MLKHSNLLCLLFTISFALACNTENDLGSDSNSRPSDLVLEVLIRNSSNESVIKLQKGEVATFVLTVLNDTSEEINITYSSSQKYDFLVLNDTDEVWKWSYDKVFTQAIVEESILPNTSISFEEEWNQVDNYGISVDAGSYVLKAIYRGTAPEHWGIFNEITFEFSIEE